MRSSQPLRIARVPSDGGRTGRLGLGALVHSAVNASRSRQHAPHRPCRSADVVAVRQSGRPRHREHASAHIQPPSTMRHAQVRLHGPASLKASQERGRVAAPISQKSEKKSNMIKTLKARAPDIPGPSHTLPDTQDTCQHSTEHPDIDLSSIYLSSPPSPLCAEPSYM